MMRNGARNTIRKYKTKDKKYRIIIIIIIIR